MTEADEELLYRSWAASARSTVFLAKAISHSQVSHMQVT